MTPEEKQIIHDRLMKLELEKSTSDAVLAGIKKCLEDIQSKIDKALIYHEKHDNLSKEVETLRKDYADKKQEIDRSVGWLKGSFATAGVTVAVISSLMLFIAKDGLSNIKEQESRISEVKTQVDRLESRLSVANPKSP